MYSSSSSSSSCARQPHVSVAGKTREKEDKHSQQERPNKDQTCGAQDPTHTQRFEANGAKTAACSRVELLCHRQLTARTNNNVLVPLCILDLAGMAAVSQCEDTHTDRLAYFPIDAHLAMNPNNNQLFRPYRDAADWFNHTHIDWQ